MSVRPSIRATLYSATITAAITAVAQAVVGGLTSCRYLVLQANFVYGSGGTSADVWVQTSVDGGVTWFDIANFHFLVASGKKIHVIDINPATPFPPATVPASGALAANTILNGVLGDRFRALVTTVGTYAGGTTFAVDMVAKG
jgi:hypothetical protein